MNMNIKTREGASNKTKRHGWLWVIVILLVIAIAGFAMFATGVFVPSNNNQTAPESDVAVVVATDSTESDVIRPACAVIEDALLDAIVSDDDTDWQKQESSARVYSVLSERGCPENAQFFEDMAQRKQTIADGLRAMTDTGKGVMASAEYLYSDERICQTIEKRIIQNINTDANDYKEFLANANTYSVLYQFGCVPNKRAYARAAVRELGVSMALVPPEHMTQEEIVIIMEVYKRLKNMDGAHMVLQRLKARGYDMDFILSMEDIIHGMA